MAHLPPIAQAIIQTVAYVDIFDYPLTLPEIHRYLIGHTTTIDELHDIIHHTLIPHQLQCQDHFYTLPQRQSIVATRQQRTTNAAQLWPVAHQYARQIAQLPFIHMIAVTGSLAVDNPDPHADIDYFIITTSGRLWLARALTILVVRLAARHGHHLCPNYFLAHDALALPHHDLYIAREIAQMIPLYGLETYQLFRHQNLWVNNYLPNATTPPPLNNNIPGHQPLPPRPPLTRLLTPLLASPLASPLETWEMNRKIHKFTRHNQASETSFSPQWCKGHFHDHAQRILNQYDEQLQQLQPDTHEQ